MLSKFVKIISYANINSDYVLEVHPATVGETLSSSLAWPDPLGAGAYQLEIISAAWRGAYNLQSISACAKRIWPRETS